MGFASVVRFAASFSVRRPGACGPAAAAASPRSDEGARLDDRGRLAETVAWIETRQPASWPEASGGGRRSKPAQCAWRPTNPCNRLYLDVKQRTGKSNPAKSAVARKVLIAAWQVLAREEPFKPGRAERGADPVPASSHVHLAA
jgi:hypothetical protein